MNVEFNDNDFYLFGKGLLYQGYRVFGAHRFSWQNQDGIMFTVYAPKAKMVRLLGDFNHWDGSSHSMDNWRGTGIWRIFIPDLQEGALYKYEVVTDADVVIHKADPYAFYSEMRPATASRIYHLEGYVWHDQSWQQRSDPKCLHRPMNIYEMHLGSWRLHEDGSFLRYTELAELLPDYLQDMGYTHVEFLPLMEHPYDGSWGYQITGYFSATSRYGSPKELMYLIDRLHQAGIGVIMDWVPVHFCKDAHGLMQWDGSALYEYGNEIRAEQSNWGTRSFDLGKPQVQSFLISNALFWLEYFHVDGLRVDAVASMLYLDFEREEHQWFANQYGERENMEGIEFLHKLNMAIEEYHPQVMMIAEESSAWNHVTKPVAEQGLGFNLKWNMGWMNDTLRYMEMDPLFRRDHHHLLTFSLCYAFSERFILPISHDEVVHGKKSLLDKMPGDYWRKFANLRVFLGYMMTHPGKKLLFMGSEIGQFIEWDERRSLDWFLLEYDMHRQYHDYVKALNHFYLQYQELWDQDDTPSCFAWLGVDDNLQSVVSFSRYDGNGNHLIVVCNFTPVVHDDYRLGVPSSTDYKEIFNSDESQYGGSSVLNTERLSAEQISWHHYTNSIRLHVPPLGIVVLAPIREKG